MPEASNGVSLNCLTTLRDKVNRPKLAKKRSSANKLEFKTQVSKALTMKVTLLTGRTIDQGVGKEHGKLSENYQNSVAVCQIDQEDLEKLGIKENENVKVITEFGSVVLKAVKSKRSPHSRVVFVPYSPWASLLMNYRTYGTGMPSFKGAPAEVKPAPGEKVLSLLELIKQNFRKK